MTVGPGKGSQKTGLFFSGLVACLVCQGASGAQAGPMTGQNTVQHTKTTATTGADTTHNTAGETTLGLADIGIFSDLDDKLRLPLPPRLSTGDLTATWDPHRKLLILFEGDWPLKAYPTEGNRTLIIGDQNLALRLDDYQELAPLAASITWRGALNHGLSDRDGDGIPDALDVILGAHKVVLNGASYGGGYLKIDYPGGDIPRGQGVCTDVVVRAFRNAGVDIQSELQDDIKRKASAYSMVKKRNPNIDHRRVKTLLPYFKRQWQAHTIEQNNADDPYRAGDVIFMDTLPARSGPDHIGIISNTIGASGLPLVVNNWTDGSRTAEMDLLTWVPITHRFRLRPAKSKLGKSRPRR